MKLNSLKVNKKENKNPKRIGRGIGSGRGKTSGAGHKGQKSRSGVSINGFEGGQMPIHRRLPKRGFNNKNRKKFSVINISRIQDLIDSGKINGNNPIDEKVILSAGVVNKIKDGIRLLGNGDLKDKIEIHVTGASKKAIDIIEAKGGKVVFNKKIVKKEQG